MINVPNREFSETWSHVHQCIWPCWQCTHMQHASCLEKARMTMLVSGWPVTATAPPPLCLDLQHCCSHICRLLWQLGSTTLCAFDSLYCFVYRTVVLEGWKMQKMPFAFSFMEQQNLYLRKVPKALRSCQQASYCLAGGGGVMAPVGWRWYPNHCYDNVRLSQSQLLVDFNQFPHHPPAYPPTPVGCCWLTSSWHCDITPDLHGYL